jgi:hypothetical protein
MKNRLCVQCGERYAGHLSRCPSCDTHAPRDQERPAQSHGTNCAAHGCPLPGSVSDNTRGEGPWTCSPHRRADSKDWPAVTERLTANRWLVKAMTVLRTEDVTPELAQRISYAANERGFSPLAWVEDEETVRQWAYRFQMSVLAFADTGRCESRPKQRPWIPKPGNVGGLSPFASA